MVLEKRKRRKVLQAGRTSTGLVYLKFRLSFFFFFLRFKYRHETIQIRPSFVPFRLCMFVSRVFTAVVKRPLSNGTARSVMYILSLLILRAHTTHQWHRIGTSDFGHW